MIGITMGDPAGIGPEVIAAALSGFRCPSGVEFLVIGNMDVFTRFWPRGKELPLFIHIAENSARHISGRPTLQSGRDSLAYLDKAVEMLKKGSLQALVTGPVSKESVAHFVKGFKGHTTYLANAFGKKNVEMVFVADDIKMVLVTRHIPLKEVSSRVTRLKVESVIETTHAFLVNSFGIKAPKIAVCGLNPHAGEGGAIGQEEIREIIPAMNRLKKKKILVYGPFPADTLFEPRNRRGYDLIVTMYHDQGLTALKSLYFDKLVNLTVGLPFIRTSPAHGTAFGIAGKGVANSGSMLESIRLAGKFV
ncbi:MAG: 4-hydroxythreonine-4-phosphate dehydrogenase PdxA [Candidatus Omnitrophica bacterium]|nr:4-hydroxythreonine-4-phosphate dehydrogenase PdxA [Candidatus Omnitrophota bacterium]